MPKGFGRAAGGLPGAAARMALLLLVLLVSTFYIPSSRGQSIAPRASQVQIHLKQAQAAVKAHDPRAAIAELRAALALDPENIAAHVNLGVIAFFQGDCQTASRHFRRALTIQPKLAQAKALLGICETRSGRSDGKALLESSYSELKDKGLRTEVGLELVELYYREGNLDRASSLIHSLVNLNPDNVDVLYMAQRVYTELADDTLNKLAVLAPGSARMQQVIAERLVNAGDLKGAIGHYRKALEIDPQLAGVHFELGEAILESSPHDPQAQADAEKEFESAAKMEGDSASIECQLGRIALMRLDVEKAYAHYHQAFAMSPGDSEAQLGLGAVLLTMQKPQEAVKYLRLAVQSDPLNSEAHYRLATAYRNLHLTGQAEKEMRLFNELKQTMDQVRQLYRQMNQQPKPQGLPGSPR